MLFLDEPTTGLDPQARRAMWEVIETFSRTGKTVFLTTHYMEEATQLCDRIVIMDQGKILVTGKPDQLIKEYTGNHIVETEMNEEVITCLNMHSIPYDVAGEKIQIFTQDPKEITRMLLNECAIGHVSARQTTLEDVFLKLTGRTLRE
jgi:lipooligosaccharide transport system ATP-binding protein